MRYIFRISFLLTLGFLATGCATTAKFPRTKTSAFDFAARNKPPIVYVVSPSININAAYMMTDRSKLEPHIKRAHDEIARDFERELQSKGYQAFEKQVDFEGHPKDDLERRTRWVIADANGEFDLMARILFRNAVKENDRPLDYGLGRLSVELAELSEPRPDWLLFVQSGAYVQGILPLSEVEDPTLSQKMGALMGIGIASPGYDYIVHVVGIVDAKSGQLLWFNVYSQLGKSIIFPSDRRDSVKNVLSKLPNYNASKKGASL